MFMEEFVCYLCLLDLVYPMNWLKFVQLRFFLLSCVVNVVPVLNHVSLLVNGRPLQQIDRGENRPGPVAPWACFRCTSAKLY
jgi:hypothetical protein